MEIDGRLSACGPSALEQAAEHSVSAGFLRILGAARREFKTRLAVHVFIPARGTRENTWNRRAQEGRRLAECSKAKRGLERNRCLMETGFLSRCEERISGEIHSREIHSTQDRTFVIMGVSQESCLELVPPRFFPPNRPTLLLRDHCHVLTEFVRARSGR